MGVKKLQFVYLTRGLIGSGGVSNDTAARLWRSLSSTCKKHGISFLTLVGDQPGSNHQQSMYRHIQDGWADGIISWSSMGTVESDQDLSRFVKTPVVCLSRKVPGRPVVRIDNAEGIRELITHLIQVHDLHKIAFIRGPESHPYSQTRWKTYSQTLTSFGIPYDRNLVSPWGNWDKNTGINALELFLDKRHLLIGKDIQAIVCANDRIAVGVIEELTNRGYQCPRDVYVTGFNHLPESDKTEPVLTTVHMPFEEQAERAVELLLQMIGQPQKRVEDIILHSSLLVRESCGCSNFYSELSSHKSPIPGKQFNNSTLIDHLSDFIPAELLPSFESSWNSRSEIDFLQGIDNFITKSPRQTSTITQLVTTFNTIRALVYPNVSNSNDLLFMERMLGSALGRAVKIDFQFRAKGEIQSFLRGEVMQKIDLVFALETDLGVLYQKLFELLPKVGIPSFYVVLYGSDDTAQLDFGFTDSELIPPDEKNQIFPGTGLPLMDLRTRDSHRQFLLRAIAFGSRAFGYVIFELGPLDGTMYDAIAYKLSSTINNVMLNREIEQKIVDLNSSNVRLENSISELKNTQDQLVQTQKMAALGELIAGVAHEMNTPLGVALTASTFLESEISEWKKNPTPQLTEGITEAGELIVHNIQRANNLVEHLKKTLDEPMDVLSRNFNFGDLLADVELLIGHLGKNPDIEIKHNVHPLNNFNGPVQILQEILVQLISNAVYHGFPQGGPGTIEINAGLEGDFLILSVIDNGIGMSEEILKKVFNPFFTTRRGKGNIGLGLHGIFNLITQTLGGTIECSSTPNRGTSIILHLPKEKFTSPETMNQ